MRSWPVIPRRCCAASVPPSRPFLMRSPVIRPAECIHGVVPRDRDDSTTVGHDDVFPLPRDMESHSLQSLDGAKVRDSGNFRHVLRRNFHFPQILLAGQTSCHFDVFANSIPNVRQGLRLCGALRPAAGQTRAGNAIPLFGADQGHRILHMSHFIKVQEQQALPEEPIRAQFR